jgi:hypothetical protein
MLVAMTALVASFAGPAVADEVATIAKTISGKQIKNNSVTTGDIKNGSLTGEDIRDGGIATGDIGTGQVQTPDLGDNAIRGDKVQANTLDSSDLIDNTLTGGDIDESTLGQVPNARQADRLGSLTEGDVKSQNLFIKLGLDESREILRQGPLKVYARCSNRGGDDYIELFAGTDVDGSLMSGDDGDDLEGGPNPEDFLNVDTPEEDRMMNDTSNTTDEPYMEGDYDTGWIIAPDGSQILWDEENQLLGVNVFGAKCVVAGRADLVPAS